MIKLSAPSHRCLSIGAAILLSLVSFATPAQKPAATVFPDNLLAAAQQQIGVTLYYDAAYARLAYPNGDVPRVRGVCTDVLIRAYRALGIDLQQRVHEDMRAAWAAYPKLWGLRGTDRNIDHRRVPNLATFFTRHGKVLKVSQTDAALYQAGDIVTWRLPSGVPHIGLVAARRYGGRPLIVHNIGGGTQLEDMLFDYTITGHYRFEPTAAP
ncbi:hypothetical protein DFR29_11166 [Tahibacter aquaticus]|uniref:DUF1287 domain-containing protein n=1 Tax=Tahibacter aquaticus TaxID=520092 RepID=A0A4V3DLU8_9GAMM|nr:DUF1287 domain-containing protein [Tahibacter aquaticus]TDR41154.1 hypothetical protein DFR29_11166 [Tahibacter aquaticus]